MSTPTKEKAGKYIEAVGRRKTSSARVRITPANKESFVVNSKSLSEYFPTADMEQIVKEVLVLTGNEKAFAITVQVKGGGIHSQSEAVSHGLSRAIVKYNREFKDAIKQAKLLTRDPREKERRKFGLKKARKAPQWSKR